MDVVGRDRKERGEGRLAERYNNSDSIYIYKIVIIIISLNNRSVGGTL